MENVLTATDELFIRAQSARLDRNFDRWLCVLCTVLLVAAMVLMSGTAAGTQSITDGIKNGAKQLFELMESIVVPIAAVCFAWNGLKVLFGGERGMEQAKKNMLIIIIVLALVFLAPLIVVEVSKWFNDGKGTWSSIK